MAGQLIWILKYTVIDEKYCTLDPFVDLKRNCIARSKKVSTYSLQLNKRRNHIALSYFCPWHFVVMKYKF